MEVNWQLCWVAVQLSCQFASILGKIKHWARYIPRGRLALRKVQHWLQQHWNQRTGHWNDRILLDVEVIRNLAWWRRERNYTAGIPLHPPIATLEMLTDASTSGWGATLGNLQARGTWSAQEKTLHINILEMRAVLCACKAFRHQLTGSVTRTYIDNATTVTYLRKEGGTHSLALLCTAN